jgi:predicted N-acetyltransferase YhbS
MQQDKELEKRIRERVSVSEDNIVSLDIVLDDAHAISHIGIKERELIIYGCKTMVGCIGGVATKSDYRQKGLATRLMKRSVQQINEDQGDIMLVSGDRDLYRRQRCFPAAPMYRIHVTRSDAEKFDDSNMKFVPYNQEYLPHVINIHQKEPVRFHRDMPEFRVMLERRTPAPFWTRTEVFMLIDGDDVLGHIVIQEPRDDRRGKGRVRAIAEYAGVRSAIADSIKLLFDRYKMEELLFFAPEHELEFLHILHQMGIRGEKRNLGGHTFRIVNLPRFMDRFTPYIEERIGKDRAALLNFAQESEKFTIIYKQDRLELDDESLVALMFGTSHGIEDEVISRSEEMAELLQALFPLPFLWPGLNSY